MKKIFVAAIPILLPFFIAPFLLDVGLLPAYLLLSLYSVALWVLLLWQNRQNNNLQIPSAGLVTWFAVGFILWSGINISYSLVPADALFNFVRYSIIATFAGGLYLLLVNNKQLISPLLKGVSISAILSASIGFYQLMPIWDYVIKYTENTYNITGLLGHKNLFSSWLMLLLPLIGIGLIKSNKAWRFIGSLALCMVSVLILFVQSRATWLSIGLAISLITLLVVVAFAFKPTAYKAFWAKAKTKMVGLLAVPLAVLAITFVAKPDLFVTIQQKLSHSINYMGQKNPDSETIKERLFLWKHTMKMINESPALGHGGGSWRILFPQYGLQENRSQQGYIHFQRPHNDWLWITAEYGIIGVALWAMLWLSIIVLLIRQFWNNLGTDNGSGSLLLLFGVLAFLVNGIFDFPLERSTHLGLMSIMLALAFTNQPTLNLIRRRTRLIWVALGFSIILSLLSYMRLRGEALTTYTYTLNEIQDYNKAIALSKTASSFIYRIDGVSAPIEYYQGIAWLGLKENQNALNAFKLAYNRNPNHLLVLNNLGSTWQFVGEPDSAKYYYRKAIAISPRFEEPLLNIGAIYFNDHTTDSAYHYLSSIYPDSKNPRYRPSINALLKVEVRLLKQQTDSNSDAWQQLDALEQNPEELFNLYFKAWENANKTYQPLTRDEFLKILATNR